MAEGIIIQSISGYYDVKSGDEVYRCRARGNFRKKKVTPLVGDKVEFEESYVLDVKPRRNQLLRPPIANIDQAIVVFSAEEPMFHPLLLDRFLVRLEADGIQPVICFSKFDLAERERRQAIEKYGQDYRNIGYNVLLTSTVTMEGLDELLECLSGQISVFAGQSGVGKTSLLNALKPGLSLEIGEISHALGRGKHTTRRVALFPINSGYVADTPGFSSLDFRDIESVDLSLYFPEMRERSGDCKFRGCTHLSEPKCAVKEAVSSGEICGYRYEHYKQFYEEIQGQKRRY